MTIMTIMHLELRLGIVGAVELYKAVVRRLDFKGTGGAYR